MIKKEISKAFTDNTKPKKVVKLKKDKKNKKKNNRKEKLLRLFSVLHNRLNVLKSKRNQVINEKEKEKEEDEKTNIASDEEDEIDELEPNYDQFEDKEILVEGSSDTNAINELLRKSPIKSIIDKFDNINKYPEYKTKFISDLINSIDNFTKDLEKQKFNRKIAAKTLFDYVKEALKKFDGRKTKPIQNALFAHFKIPTVIKKPGRPKGSKNKPK